MRRVSLLCVALIIGVPIGGTVADAAPQCSGACVVISGHVVGPKAEAVPSYTVIVQNSTYNTTVTTDATGAYSTSVPITTSDCYQIVGVADPYYSNAPPVGKTCVSDSSVDLHPLVRIQSFSGLQKEYYPDATQPLSLPVDVRALSRTPNAAWASDPMPYGFDYEDPMGVAPSFSSDGTFNGPVVDQISSGVWRYTWHVVISVPANMPGYWDMDFGRDGSPFSPMMECRMIWFGYGTDSITPSSVIVGQTATLHGERFGATPGTVVLKGSGQVTTISGTGIVSWSDSSVTFMVPVTAKTGWAAVVPPSGIKTNAQHLAITGAPKLPQT